MDNRPIGIFDSGIGGLSVLHEAMKALPNEKYLYYADLDNVPYGTKTKEQIKQHVDAAVAFMVQKDVKAIVIACNTATSVDIESLRECYTIPMVGMEPAVKPALDVNKEKRVMLLATPVTVGEKKLHTLLENIDTNHRVDLVALPELVNFAEREEFDTQEVVQYIQGNLEQYNIDDYGAAVLGCTHFGYFKPAIQRIFNNRVVLVDGIHGTVHRLKEILEEQKENGENHLTVEYYISGRKVEDTQALEKMQRLHQRIEEMLSI